MTVETFPGDLPLINACVIRQNEPPCKIQLSPTLENLQSIVGGYIEILDVREDDIVFIVDEEGLLTKDPNRAFYADAPMAERYLSQIKTGRAMREGDLFTVLHGDFLAVRYNEEGEIAPLEESDFAKLAREFANPHSGVEEHSRIHSANLLERVGEVSIHAKSYEDCEGDADLERHAAESNIVMSAFAESEDIFVAQIACLDPAHRNEPVHYDAFVGGRAELNAAPSFGDILNPIDCTNGIDFVTEASINGVKPAYAGLKAYVHGSIYKFTDPTGEKTLDMDSTVITIRQLRHSSVAYGLGQRLAGGEHLSQDILRDIYPDPNLTIAPRDLDWSISWKLTKYRAEQAVPLGKADKVTRNLERLSSAAAARDASRSHEQARVRKWERD